MQRLPRSADRQQSDRAAAVCTRAKATSVKIYANICDYQSGRTDDGDLWENATAECPKCGQYLQLVNGWHAHAPKCKCGLEWTFDSSGACGDDYQTPDTSDVISEIEKLQLTIILLLQALPNPELHDVARAKAIEVNNEATVFIERLK